MYRHYSRRLCNTRKGKYSRNNHCKCRGVNNRIDRLSHIHCSRTPSHCHNHRPRSMDMGKCIYDYHHKCTAKDIRRVRQWVCIYCSSKLLFVATVIVAAFKVTCIHFSNIPSQCYSHRCCSICRDRCIHDYHYKCRAKDIRRCRLPPRMHCSSKLIHRRCHNRYLRSIHKDKSMQRSTRHKSMAKSNHRHQRIRIHSRSRIHRLTHASTQIHLGNRCRRSI
jgi:hypothetical protein